MNCPDIIATSNGESGDYQRVDFSKEPTGEVICFHRRQLSRGDGYPMDYSGSGDRW